MSCTVISDVVQYVKIVGVVNCENSSVGVMDGIAFDDRSGDITNHVEVNRISSDNFRLAGFSELSMSDSCAG